MRVQPAARRATAPPLLRQRRARRGAGRFRWQELRSAAAARRKRCTVRRAGAKQSTLITLHRQRAEAAEQIALLGWVQLIRRLPVEGFDAPIEVHEQIATLAGPLRRWCWPATSAAVNQALAAVATRLSWFVWAPCCWRWLATWARDRAVRIIRRVTLLTRRAKAVSQRRAQQRRPGRRWICRTCAAETNWACWRRACRTCCSA